MFPPVQPVARSLVNIPGSIEIFPQCRVSRWLFENTYKKFMQHAACIQICAALCKDRGQTKDKYTILLLLPVEQLLNNSGGHF